jgi:general secretion pathway protein D
LIITAEPEDYNHLKEVIDQLDTVRPQVLVEALIADVSMDVITDLGVEWGTVDAPMDDKYTGFGGTKYSIEQTTLFQRGLTFSGLVIGAMKGTTAGIPNVGMIIQAYSKRTGFKILSTPQILTLDNKEAKILVGENIPYVTSSRVTEQDTVVNSYEYKDVGIELTITPHIGQEDNLKLDIHQKVTALAPGSTTTTPSTTVREAKTSVSVDDGSTIVIGGLIRDDNTKVLYKVPLLGDIWIIGALFRRTEDTTEKRNLLIFITPYIIREKAKIEKLTQEKEELQDKFKIEETIK